MKMEDSSRTKFVRVWSQLQVDDVKKHMLYVDDLYGTCGNCKRLGLNYLKDKSCPECKTIFKYMATNSKNPADVAKLLTRIEKENIQLTMIDRDDFERSNASDAAKNLFKN
jgi:hypothetical protein